MDNTLDSIRPSHTHPQEEMSYLFGRDPSILAFGQRPCIAQESKKNLLSVYEVEHCSAEENTVLKSEAQTLQTVKVYLRLKPFPKKLRVTQEQQEAYTITNSTTLFTRLPITDSNASSLKRSHSNDLVGRKYTFTKTFGPETTQLELFEEGIKQQMTDFLAGQNCTVMTYGTTSSGKSYTLQGTTTSPGIIPRGLEFVFSNITPKPTASYKPINHCDVISLDPVERAQELEIKSKLLTFASVDKHQYINAYKEMQKLLQEESPIRPSQCYDAHYSVWVSFAEIYNETVFDLLSIGSQKKRIPLKLATDSHGRAFVKGLKTVCVNSGSEAYQVLMAGQYNLKVAATALNARSSRSHCIFTITLLKYYTENQPDSVEVSTFAFCDLAGSERLKKTLNIGDRLKEAQNINTSLLVLGRCLKSIHEGQVAKQKSEHVGPFRESKLTRLFQKALSGKEHIALIVNINPLPSLYVETQNVLSFSAIAKKIVLEQKEKVSKRKRSRFSQLVCQSIKTVTDWDATELETENSELQNTETLDSTYKTTAPDDYEDLVTENENLKREIANLKNSTLTRDLEIRRELADTYMAMMKELEADWKNRIKDVEQQQEDALDWSVRQLEEFYKNKLDQLSSRKRRRSRMLDSDSEDDLKNIEEIELENSRLTSRLVALKSSMKEVKEANKVLNEEKNKVAFELGLTKDELKSVKQLLNCAQKDAYRDEDAEFYVEELKSQLSATQEQVKKLKVFLNEAKEEYVAITTEVREKEYVIKKQGELLIENEDKIEELEDDIQNANICLTEKIKAVEILEEKLENQIKMSSDTDDNIKHLNDQINKLESEKFKLQDEIKLLRDTKQPTEILTLDVKCENKQLESSADSLNQDSYEEIIVKEEISSELDVSSTAEDEIEKSMHSSKAEDDIKKSMESVESTDADADEQKRNQHEEMNAIATENAELKDRLARSVNEIEILKEELESVKVKLKAVSDDIFKFEMKEKEYDAIKDNEKSDQKPAKSLVEVACQMAVQYEEAQTNTDENITIDNSSQTIAKVTKEETNQTSFILEADECELTEEWAKLTVKYDDVKIQYDEQCLRVEELTKEIVSLNEKIRSLTTENDTNNAVINEYKESIELLQNEISVIKREKGEVEDKFNSMKITLGETEKELLSMKEDHDQCIETLKSVQVDLDNEMKKCKEEHEHTISELEKELSVAKERNNIKSQCLDVHAAKITELEHTLETVTELQEQISKLNQNLEVCQAEKSRLQQLLDENNDKLLELEDSVEQLQEREREKDEEIIALQQEMKRVIQNNESDLREDKLMQLEVKNSIKDLTQTKEILSRKEEHIQHLEMRLKSFEQNAKILDLLQQSAQERQAENERLRTINEELKNSLIEKEREMEAFMKNRDEMVAKYESLVKTQQDDLEKQKTESAKLEKNRKEKDYCENTSDDEVVHKERRGRRPARKCASPAKQTDISVIELSGSESKRTVRRTAAALPPPSTETLSERKRNTRKKKLFVAADESFQDIEPAEASVIVTPSSQTRSLRSRRK